MSGQILRSGLPLHSTKNPIKQIETPYLKSEEQLAGIFTKGLNPRPFEENSRKLGMIDIYTPNLKESVKIN
jgi:hypothetical protein